GGVAPTKDCPECGEIIHATLMQCPACGHEFPLRIETDPPRLRNDDIIGLSGREVTIESRDSSKHVSPRSGKAVLKLRYYGQLSDSVVKEYVTLLHRGYAGRKALQTITAVANHCGVSMAQFGPDSTLDDLADKLNDAQDRKSTRLNSSHVSISYAVFCLKKKNIKLKFKKINIDFSFFIA